MTTLRVLLHVAAQRDYELHSLNFSTTFLQGRLHEEIWLRRPPGFTGSFPAGTQNTLAALGFAPSSVDPSLFYVLVYIVDFLFATADTEALALVKAELQERHICTDLGPSALRLPLLLATAHSSVYRPLALSSTFGQVLHRAWGSCLKDGVQWYSHDSLTLLGLTTRRLNVRHRVIPSVLALVLSRGVTYLLTYLLTVLGERPPSPPFLYVDNKAMLALCREQRLEHRTKHIALRYFLARELQQRGELRLSYMASRTNTADVFTKAIRS
ncbi:unnamed protein product, partial [Closterium sp. NIES-53]